MKQNLILNIKINIPVSVLAKMHTHTDNRKIYAVPLNNYAM